MKTETIYQRALSEFKAALAHTSPTDVEAARVGCGLLAARFACTYVTPKKNQPLYDRIYNIFWNYYHPKGEK